MNHMTDEFRPTVLSFADVSATLAFYHYDVVKRIRILVLLLNKRNEKLFPSKKLLLILR